MCRFILSIRQTEQTSREADDVAVFGEETLKLLMLSCLQLVLQDFSLQRCDLQSVRRTTVTGVWLSSQEEVCLAELEQKTWWLVPSPPVLLFLREVQAPSSPQLE